MRREYPTAIGPVDLMCRDAAGASVAVEIKRRGEIDGVEQLTRYLELLNRDPLLAPVRGIFAAQEIKPQARVLATDRGITCAVVDYDALRGLDDREPTGCSSECALDLSRPSAAVLGSAHEWSPSVRRVSMTPVFHIATAADWASAQRSGSYTTSTRGRTLEQEGFIHCSRREQVAAVWRSFYADARSRWCC